MLAGIFRIGTQIRNQNELKTFFKDPAKLVFYWLVVLIT